MHEFKDISQKYGTPLFVYSRNMLIKQAEAMLGVPAPFGLTVRYAMKANPNRQILELFRQKGVKIDASSGYEVDIALDAGYEPADILLTSQEIPKNLAQLIKGGVQYNATSLHQLESYAELFPGSEVSVRLNPGVGSGHSVKTNVGGPTSSFGIWHEYITKVIRLAKKHDLKITRIHTHIGSGTDLAVWHEVARVSLELIKNFPEAVVINLGGGFKVARMDDEQVTDMALVGKAIADELKLFQQDTDRELHLELEPGTFLVANAGILIAEVNDIVDTGKNGYTFMKLNTGMNDVLRPSLYGAQHPITVLNDTKQQQEYVVVGHNCESGDLLTPAPGQPEVIAPRHLPKARIGDLVLIGGVGAYCASMSASSYNSFPKTKEIMV